MFALVYKDFLLLRKEGMAFLFFALALLGGFLAVEKPAIAILLSMLPAYWSIAYSNAYDYKYGAEAVLASLPVARTEVVVAKYLTGLVAMGLGLGLAALGALVASLSGLLPGPVDFGFLAAAFGSSSAYLSLSLAAYFRFGYLKSRWVTILLFMALGAVVGALPAAPAGGRALAGSLALVLFDLGSLLVLALSCAYSARRFSVKEL
jgi:ABC-type transport system involved in multi-copper enzyme maturation permease subunit